MASVTTKAFRDVLTDGSGTLKTEFHYDLLKHTDSPSWLYMIRSGGTTTWERWDALRPDGTVNVDALAGGKKDANDSMV